METKWENIFMHTNDQKYAKKINEKYGYLDAIIKKYAFFLFASTQIIKIFKIQFILEFNISYFSPQLKNKNFIHMVHK